MKIQAAYTDTVLQCSCCGKRNLKRTLEISGDDFETINLGVSCAGNWFKINLSGNPFYSAARLDRHLNNLLYKQIIETLEKVEQQKIVWQSK